MSKSGAVPKSDEVVLRSIFAQFDANIDTHPKYLALSYAARALWDWGIRWCRQHLIDGQILRTSLRGFPRGDDEVMAHVLAYAAELVAAGLWDLDETGYRVLRYSEKGNQTKTAVVTAVLKRKGTQETYRAKRAAESSGSGPLVEDKSETVFGASSSGSDSISGSSDPEGMQGEAASAKPKRQRKAPPPEQLHIPGAIGDLRAVREKLPPREAVPEQLRAVPLGDAGAVAALMEQWQVPSLKAAAGDGLSADTRPP